MPQRRLKLEPTLYQVALVNYLRSEERELWAWFSSAEAQRQYVEALRTPLRQDAQHLEPAAHPELMQAAREAKAALGLNPALALYLAQPAQAGQFSATLVYIPGEAHIVLSGPLLLLLEPEELKAILAHELAHYGLWERNGGQFLVADRILQAMTEEPRAASSHHQSARRYRLHGEIYADRGALAAVEDLHTVVAALAKAETGARRVNAGAYLKPGALPPARLKRAGRSHPELLIRAQALRLWARKAKDLDARVAAMIQTLDSPAELDLLSQARYARLTRRLLEQLLRPRWFQTDAALAHAKSFFADFKPVTRDDPGLVQALRVDDPTLRKYVACLLLDFAVADPRLADLSLAAVWDWGRRLNMDSELETLLSRELRLKPRQIRLIRHESKKRLKQAERSVASSGVTVQ